MANWTAAAGAVRDLGLEVVRLRDETPGCAEVAHFNHAGSSLMPQPVIDALLGHLEREVRTGGYEAEDEAAERIDAVYGAIATLIGGAPDEVAIVENATRAWDMAFYGIAFEAGDRILTTVSEYGSNAIAFLQVARRGVRVEVVPNDEHGQLDVAKLAEMLDEKVKVLAVTHMPTNGGLVQPAAAIGRLTRQAGALYLLDACQTVGQMPIDVRQIGCDILSATSRKFLRGPRGVGFLWVRRPIIDQITPPFLDIRAAEWTAPDEYVVHPSARRFENWESHVAGKVGMGAAVDYALDLGLDAIWARVHRQADLLRRRLADVPGVAVHDLGAVKGGIVAFTVAGAAPGDVQSALRVQAINVSTSSPSSTRWDMETRGLRGLVRASVHYLTTDEEVSLLVDHVAALADKR